MVREIVRNIKVKDISELIAKLELSPEQSVNITIEQTENQLLAIMDKIGYVAQEKGLTPEKLEELLQDES